MSSTVNLKVDGQKIALDKRVLHVQGTQGFYKIKAYYGEGTDWSDASLRVAVFAYTPDYEACANPVTQKMAVEFNENDECQIPNQFLRKVGVIEVGIIGYSEDGEVKVTTAPLEPGSNKIRVVKAIADTTTVAPDSPDTPDIWVELRNEIGDMTALETVDKSSLVAAINELFNRPSGVTVEEVQEIVDTAVDAEEAAREQDDEVLRGAIETESEARTAADQSLTEQLAEEAAARKAFDATLNDTITAETTNRENADSNLQSQIDGITASSDVKDIVGTKAELDSYDTATLGNNDIIKVLQDESENDATTYYRWNATTSSFNLIGEEGPYYTKSQADEAFTPQTRTVNGKPLSENITLDAEDVGAVATEVGKGLSTEDFTTAEKTKLDGLANIKSIGNNLELDPITGELSSTSGDTQFATGESVGEVSLSGIYPTSLNPRNTTIPTMKAVSWEITSNPVTTGANKYLDVMRRHYASATSDTQATESIVRVGINTATGLDITMTALSNMGIISGVPFTGAADATDGTMGMVPAPGTTDTDKFLKGDGTWSEVKGSVVVDLTAADYNFPEAAPTSVAFWLLEPGIYRVAEDLLRIRYSTTATDQGPFCAGTIFIVGKSSSTGGYHNMLMLGAYFQTTSPSYYTVTSDGGKVSGYRADAPHGLLPTAAIVNNLTTTNSDFVLSAAQGKALNDKITALEERVAALEGN